MKKIILGIVTMLSVNQTVYAGVGDDPLRSMVLMDRFEVFNNNEHTKVWEGNLYLGYDINKLYLYTAGEATTDGLESSQNELVYSRAIAPFWDAQIGIVYDKNTDTSQTWDEVAISGLAPYWFETRVALLFNADGNIGLRMGAEYETLFTQQLILSSSIEADLYTKEDDAMQLGSGISSIEAGLRLRYEIKREIAPYIGVNWKKIFGNTRNDTVVNETDILYGVRFWF